MDHTLRELFTRAFRDGCGIEFEQILQSSNYQQRCWSARQRLESRDCQIARRAGYWHFGTLLNRMPERQALQRTRGYTALIPRNPDEEVLIQILGEQLVATATQVLGTELQTLAHDWSTLNIEDQRVALEILYDILCECASGIAFVRPHKSWQARWSTGSTTGKIPSIKYLPPYFPLLAFIGQQPSCLGKTILQVAFARAAKIPALLATPVVSQGQVRNIGFAQALDTFFDFLGSRRLVSEADQAEYLANKERARVIDMSQMEAFHSAAALKLSDGSWHYVDPTMRMFGRLNEQVDRADRLLGKYQAALPGLSVCAHDNGRFEQLVRRVNRSVDNSIALADKLLASLMSRRYSFEEVICVIDQNRVAEYVLSCRHGSLEERRKKPLWQCALDLLITAAPVEDAQLNPSAMARKYNGESDEYRIAWIKRLCLFITFIGFEERAHQLYAEPDRILDPVLQLSRPEYAIGLSVLGSLCYSHDYTLQPSFFLRHAFDQVLWHDSMETTRGAPHSKREERLLRLTGRKLMQLPYVHPSCLDFLPEGR